MGFMEGCNKYCLFCGIQAIRTWPGEAFENARLHLHNKIKDFLPCNKYDCKGSGRVGLLKKYLKL